MRHGDRCLVAICRWARAGVHFFSVRGQAGKVFLKVRCCSPPTCVYITKRQKTANFSGRVNGHSMAEVDKWLSCWVKHAPTRAASYFGPIIASFSKLLCNFLPLLMGAFGEAKGRSVSLCDSQSPECRRRSPPGRAPPPSRGGRPRRPGAAPSARPCPPRWAAPASAARSRAPSDRRRSRTWRKSWRRRRYFWGRVREWSHMKKFSRNYSESKRCRSLFPTYISAPNFLFKIF